MSMSGEIKKRKSKKESNPTEDKNSSSPSKSKKDKKDKAKDDDKQVVDKKKGEEEVIQDPPPKFGPMPKLSPHRLWSRTALILGLMAVVWYNSGKTVETPFAKVGETLRYRTMKTKCSDSFDKHVKAFATSCKPNHCGRLVSDEVITPEEIYALNDLVSRGFQESKPGAAAVLDFTTGILKFNGRSVDMYKLNKTKELFNSGDRLIFQSVKSKLMRMVSSYFGIDFWSIYLAAPVYLSRLTEKGSHHKTDEYWHLTVHQDIFEPYDYSTILFLSDYKKDFEGGRFIFLDGDSNNRTVEPKKGRVLAFTSGMESKHFHEKVTKGARYSLTMGFTCDSKKAQKDPPL